MEILTLSLGILNTNAYLLINGDHATLIDVPPDGEEPLKEMIAKRKLTVDAIILTHEHWDHVLDAPLFYDSVPIIAAGEEGVSLIEEPSMMSQYVFPGIPLRKGKVTQRLLGGEQMEFSGANCEILAVPGHSPGSIAYHFPNEKVCFTGDLIFKETVGRTDIPGGDTNTLVASVKDKIFTLPPETKLLPGHGAATTVGEEMSHWGLR